MTTMVAPQQHRGWLVALRVALFTLGGFLILDSIRSGIFSQFLAAPIGEDVMATLIGIITSGAGAGILLLVLGWAAGPVVRRRGGWLLLMLVMLGAICPIAGFGLIFGPAGGDQMTTWGGIGFYLILLGTPLFFISYIWAVALAAIELVTHRRGRGAPTA